MKNLNAFGSGDSWGRFLYKQGGAPSYNPGNVVDPDGNEQESSKVTIPDGTGNIGKGECDKKRNVETPWDTESQNTLLRSLATEIQKGGNVDTIIAKAGNTLGEISFAMRKAEKVKDEADRTSFAKIGWGTEVQYFDAEGNKSGEAMPLAKANALKPEWKVLFKEVDGKTVIEVYMDTKTTAAQLDSLREKITKNIECDKDGKKIEGGTGGAEVITDDTETDEEDDDKPETIVVDELTDQDFEKLEDMTEDLAKSVHNSFAMMAKKMEIHWKWRDNRGKNHGKPLFRVQAGGGVEALTTDLTLSGSHNGNWEKSGKEVISVEKLAELGVTQERAIVILNGLSAGKYKEIVGGARPTRAERREARKNPDVLDHEFGVEADGEVIVDEPKEKKSKNKEMTAEQKEEEISDLNKDIAFYTKKVAKAKDGSKKQAKAQAKLDEVNAELEALTGTKVEEDKTESIDELDI
jgi:hypothetical protein